MKFYILTKKKIAIFGFCVLCASLALIIALQGLLAVVSTSASISKIPICSVEKEKQIVSISFDVAWNNDDTEKLLSILKQKQVKTTFFLTGDWVDQYASSVKTIFKNGHEIANHSDSHLHMTELSPEKITEQIQNCNNKIEKITGTCPTLFRAPYGEYNDVVIDSVQHAKMYCIQWNIDSYDWKDLSAEEMQKRIIDNIKPGSIILFHNGAKNTPIALSQIIEAIQKEGYQIVPVSELIYHGSYTTDHEGKQSPIDSSSLNLSSEK